MIKLTNLFQWFFSHDPLVVQGWTPARASQLEKATLEAAGVAGFHFAWSRSLSRKVS